MSSGRFFSKPWQKPTRRVPTFLTLLGRTRLSASSKSTIFVMTMFVRDSTSPLKWLSAASARLPMRTSLTTRRSVNSELTEASVTMPEFFLTRKPKLPSGLLGSVRRFYSSAITKNTFLASREKQTLHSRKETSISIRPSMSPNPKSRTRTLL